MPRTAKTPKHVKVYDTLFSQIQSGALAQGTCLPSEPELAKQLGVSRTTLRQALELLQDDHLVKNIRGKGRFVLGGHAYRCGGLERLSHPVYLCCKEPLTDTELDLRIDVPTDYYLQNLKQNTSAVVVCNRWYKSSGTVVAYSFSFLPIEVTARAGVDLASDGQMKEYLHQGIYDQAAYSTLAISCTATGRFMPMKYSLPSSGPHMMIYEVIYGHDDQVLAVSKHYIAPENCEVVVCAKPVAAQRAKNTERSSSHA